MQKRNATTPQEALAQAIRTGRVKVGLSQEALALAAEIDRTYISQIERGIANPSLLILHRIAAAMGAELQISLEFGTKDSSHQK